MPSGGLPCLAALKGAGLHRSAHWVQGSSCDEPITLPRWVTLEAEPGSRPAGSRSLQELGRNPL